MKPTLTIGVVLAILLNAPAHGSEIDQAATDSQRLQAVIRSAEQLRARSQALGFEWTSIGPLIHSAYQLRDQGDLQAAIRAATEATLHARLAIQQADHAQQHWQLELP